MLTCSSVSYEPEGVHDTHRPSSQDGFDSDSDDDSESDGEVGAQAPPLTKQISNILNRYPEGGQILKVPTTIKNKINYVYT